MHTPKIAFIGAGNMARAIIGGLLAEGFDRTQISASGPRQETLDKVAAEFSIPVSIDNLATAAAADVVILGVKPQVLKEVALALKPALGHKPLLISIAAGITTQSLAQWLGEDQAIVRCMPNTPSQLRAGASGLFANARVSDGQKSIANSILGAVGIVQWVKDEAQLNPVTAVSGSGPAYFFLVMEAMIEAGVKLGLERECATELTLQTAMGAAMLAKSSDLEVAELRRRVTSPKGTTEQAILSFERDDIRGIVERAMGACSQRAQELSELLGQ
ncbi:pyrroline-5-carboxylate reductase [Cellvibrio japonicus]|uniref:Pyrroline-5-carboxylate reductase n=1 Tax=Cellvibrio japonicus (strain Ueda107) TaxID=498211 RepID=B3PFH3_CELJU|nr:pyrroline-5-carboxylate reductase [Cellvibrio japonicus Ueda107]QEI10842.1 pyrroline-5-carboxylate reductase [Cellvibrio japonicus]QEI14418.1 pyrroline-5-carboxylate reductase [Cellvibrio japonicus]QEI17996.1 pyrroline-5-carboxylate reductase [Cellvibrio japonicus]